jgi:CRP/FNR family transcriptional regulator
MSTVCPVDFSPFGLPQSECPNCGLIAWCLPANLKLHESKQLNDRIEHHRLIKRNEYIHHAGSPLTSLYVIHSGFLKTSITDGDGRDQVAGFHMTGELVGMDAIGAGKHQCDAIALEDSHLCGMRYSDFEQLGQSLPALQHHFHRVMGAEIARDHGLMLLLGGMRAEERVAIFLLNLSKRFSARGYSGTHFRLPMPRQDIASYLGLTTETVSRLFSHFDNLQLIAINCKDVEVKSLVHLQQVVGDYNPRWSLPRRTKLETS